MSVSFIYNNLAFYYRIDSINRSLPVIVWKCKSLPVHGEAQSMEHMYEQIKQRLKQYYRNRKPKVDAESVANNRSLPARETKVCTDCGISVQGRENETNKCDQHDFE
jgi:TPP-dependent indolepyruvate ferredoxin oxidoreductase alpha subunit